MERPEAPLLGIELSHDSRLCYAMQQSRVPLVPLLRLENTSGSELRDLELRVELRPGLGATFSRRIAVIAAGGVCNLADIAIEVQPEASHAHEDDGQQQVGHVMPVLENVIHAPSFPPVWVRRWLPGW